MPESTSNIDGTANGSTVAIPTQKTDPDTEVERYRPKASTAAVHDAVIGSLTSVVGAALLNASNFVHLAEFYDRDKTNAIRHGHLIDATECMEIAMTHLGQLKAALNHRLRTEDEHNVGEPAF